MIRILLNFLYIVLCTLPLNLFARTDSARQQILVFRNNGEINLFYSDELKGIEIIDVTSDKNSAETILAQKFIFEDKDITIPISEIDSVTFGLRSNIVPKINVSRLSDKAATNIETYDGNTITFKSDTPQDLIPLVGEKIYYNDFTEVLPYGLCGEVKSIENKDGKIILAFDEKNPKELFDQYLFVAESLSSNLNSPLRNEKRDPAHIIKYDFEHNNTKFGTEISLPLSVNLENIVANVLSDYYHADISLRFTPEIALKFLTTSSEEIDHESRPLLTLPIPIGGNVFNLTVDLSVFIKLVAEIGIEYDFTQDFYVAVEWTRKNGIDSFSEPKYSISDGDKTAKIEAHLYGSLFFGPQIKLSLGILFNSIGTSLRFRIGPKISGELSLGVLQSLSEKYEEEAYMKGQLDFLLTCEMRSFWYYRNLLTGEIQEHPLIFEADFSSDPQKLNLFPEFTTRAVCTNPTSTITSESQDDTAISIATYTETELENSLNIGFNLIDTQREVTLQSVFEEDTNVAVNNTEALQFFSEEFLMADNLKNMDLKNIKAQPFFIYKDFIIRAFPVDINDDIIYSPIISTGSANGMYIVSGMPFVNQKSINGMTFIEGNLMPVTSKNNKFKIGWRNWRSESAENVSFDSLNGTWNGLIKGQAVTIVFTSESVGSYNGHPFTYSLESIHNGILNLKFNNGKAINLIIKSLTKDIMKVAFGNTTSTYTLTKI